MKAGAGGGIEAVVKAINTHINNPGVCKWGCAALTMITANSKVQTKLSKANEINS